MGLLTPDRYMTAVEAIDLDDLWRAGVRGLLLDRDNTVVPRTTGMAPDRVVEWMERARDMGFKRAFVSNNSYENAVRDADEFGVPLFAKARKPLPTGIRRAMAQMGLRPDEVVLIGDQVYTDVWGARAAGIFSVLVVPQCLVDLWYSGPLRALERAVLHGLEPSDTWTPLCSNG